MTFYKKHVFFCNNLRQNGKKCCENAGASHFRDYTKAKIKALALENIRINTSGCLGRCELGPAIVVYPEGIWYTYHNENDIDEIIHEHLVNDRIVTRLQLLTNNPS